MIIIISSSVMNKELPICSCRQAKLRSLSRNRNSKQLKLSLSRTIRLSNPRRPLNFLDPMASGSSGRPSSGSKGFDFGSDDILCDYGNQDSSNGNSLSDPVIGACSGKEFHKSRMARSAIFPAPVYSQHEDSFDQDVISTVEKSMKKYADNLMRFLEGISSRLSQLELYCYNLDKSIGEMRSDLTRDHGEADTKLKSLEKHLQEVHRSVQILRDKQELAETQKELAKLQLVQKESSMSSHSQSNEDRASPPSSSDPKRSDDASEAQNQQLALALPHQVAPQQQSMAPPQVPPQNVNQQQSYYLPPSQFTTPQVQSQVPQSQYLSSDPQYRTSQLQDLTRVAPQPVQSQVNQTPASQPFQVNQTPDSQPFPQYQQQWSQQLPQQVAPPQQPTLQSQNRPPPTYPPYQPNQPTNPSPPETLPNSMPMQMPFPGIPQPGPSRADTVPYGYGGTGRTVQQQPLPQQPPPQQLKGTFGAQPGDGYAAAGPHSGNVYMMYDSEGGRAHHPHQPHFQQSGYPPSNSQANSGTMVRNPSHPQFARNHPYNELVEKLVNMGFRGDHVVNVIQRMEESGQPVDFNGVLDRLNVHSSGAPQRGWSG